MRQVQLIVEPDDGSAPIINAIRHANRTIDLTIYRFDRRDVEAALAAAAARGVQVRALIAFSNSGGTHSLRRLEWQLLEAGATVARTSNDFTRYHAKLMIVDSRTLYVFGFNFTRADLKSRSFGIATTNRRLVQQAMRLFEADLTRRPYVATDDGLAVSPENARSRLESFIRGARKDLLLYDLKLSDTRMLRMIEERMKAGVQVRVIGHIAKKTDVPVSKLHHRRLHLRAIVRDGVAAFIGSQSLRKPELDARREVGIFVNDPYVVRQIQETFERDWPSHSVPIANDSIEDAGAVQ